METNNWQQHLERHADVRGGRVCVRGTRIAVADILGWFAAGLTENDILEDFPDLSRNDIRAALLFASVGEDYLVATDNVAA